MDNEAIEQLIRDHLGTVGSKPNVVAIGVGRRIVLSRQSDEPCIWVGVERKLPKSSLRKEDLVPVELADARGFAIRTDIVEVGKISLHGEKHRPLRSGCSIGRYKGVKQGTFGGFAFSKTYDSHVGLLSTHATLLPDRADERPKSREIIQPWMGRSPQDVVGILGEVIPISTHHQKNLAPLNFTETATFNLTDVTQLDTRIIDDETRLIHSISAGYEGAKLSKVGSRTGLTHGYQLGYACARFYLPYNSTREWFWMEAIRVGGSDGQAFSEPGDSGALVYLSESHSKWPTVVGMVLGGGDKVWFITRITTAFELLNLKPLPSPHPSEPRLSSGAELLAAVASLKGGPGRSRLTPLIAALVIHHFEAAYSDDTAGKVIFSAIDEHIRDLLTLCSKDPEVLRSVADSIAPQIFQRNVEALENVKLEESMITRGLECLDLIAARDQNLSVLREVLRPILRVAEGRSLLDVLSLKIN
jgi:hypothetical protein